MMKRIKLITLGSRDFDWSSLFNMASQRQGAAIGFIMFTVLGYSLSVLK